MQSEKLKDLVVDALDDLKAVEVNVLNVADLTAMADWMVVASGTSNRHVKSLADKVSQTVKESGIKPLGVEGTDDSGWVLLDFGDVILHVMLPATRAFYDLEKLWSVKPAEHESN